MEEFSGREKRRYDRVYFNPNDDVTGRFHFPDSPDGIFEAKILNLSIGGMYFTAKRDADLNFQTNDIVILKEIQTSINFHLDISVTLKVRRVQNHEIVEFVGYGCEFVEINDSDLAQVDKLVNWGLKERA